MNIKYDYFTISNEIIMQNRASLEELKLLSPIYSYFKSLFFSILRKKLRFSSAEIIPLLTIKQREKKRNEDRNKQRRKKCTKIELRIARIPYLPDRVAISRQWYAVICRNFSRAPMIRIARALFYRPIWREEYKEPRDRAPYHSNHEEPRRGRTSARGRPWRRPKQQGLVEERDLLSGISPQFHGFQ